MGSSRSTVVPCPATFALSGHIIIFSQFVRNVFIVVTSNAPLLPGRVPGLRHRQHRGGPGHRGPLDRLARRHLEDTRHVRHPGRIQGAVPGTLYTCDPHRAVFMP